MTQTIWKANDVAVFSGYTDPSMPDEDKILTVGDRLRVHAVEGQEIQVVPIVAEGEPPREGQVLYAEEITTVDAWQAAQGGETTEEVTDTANAEDAEAAAAPAVAPVKKIGKATKVGKKAAAKAAADDTEAAAAPSTGTAEIQDAEPVQGNLPGTEIEVVHASSVQALLAEKDALEAAKELVSRNEETEYTLGGVLAHIQREGIHQKLGYSGKRGFEDYIEKELGTKYRKARYLINIYEYFTALGIDETRLASIGWSKAKELVGKATKENFDDLVDYAAGHTRDELIEHLKETIDVDAGTEGETKVKMTKHVFNLFEDQNTTVTRALEAAKKQANTESMGTALEFICAEWSLTAENSAPTLEEYLELVQARFGVTLTVSHETEDGQTDIEDAVTEGEEEVNEDA